MPHWMCLNVFVGINEHEHIHTKPAKSSQPTNDIDSALLNNVCRYFYLILLLLLYTRLLTFITFCLQFLFQLRICRKTR